VGLNTQILHLPIPPKGVLYNYPVRGDEKQIIAGYPAPPEFASQVYAQALLPNLVARVRPSPREEFPCPDHARGGSRSLQGLGV